MTMEHLPLAVKKEEITIIGSFLMILNLGNGLHKQQVLLGIASAWQILSLNKYGQIMQAGDRYYYLQILLFCKGTV